MTMDRITCVYKTVKLAQVNIWTIYLQKNWGIHVTQYHKTRRKSPEHFLRYRPMSQINRKTKEFSKENLDFSSMNDILSKYDKW